MLSMSPKIITLVPMAVISILQWQFKKYVSKQEQNCLVKQNKHSTNKNKQL